MTEHVKRHFKVLFPATVLAAIIWLALMLTLEYLPSIATDPVVKQLKYLIGKTTAVLIGNGAALWLLYLYEVITSGDLFGQLVQTPESASRFAGALLVMSGLIWCFS